MLTWIRSIWPYLLIAFLYLATSPYHRGLNNPNEMVRVYASKSLVETGSFDIRPVVRKWGYVDDKALRDGVLYSSKAPLQSLVGVLGQKLHEPLANILGFTPSKRSNVWVLRIFGSVLFGILFAIAIVRWARRRAIELDAPRECGTAVGIALALGTMLYPYALTFTGHLLAAAAAGGTYLGVIRLSRHPVGARGWFPPALLTGFLAGATPFAEYPAALVALPALGAAFFITPGAVGRIKLFGALLLGGSAPFGLGLWSHARQWGSPFKTGYSFLENQSYVQMHHSAGFFGITTPKLESFGGAMFSPGTGLFFYSPVLLIGLAALLLRCVRGPSRNPLLDQSSQPLRIPRAIAVAGLIGFIAEVLFISGHQGWRGGWTLGPRYIIPVVPLLGVWTIEALAVPKIRAWVGALGGVSILLSGFASALYPHLSDVYTNPLATFVAPSYFEGRMSYGLAHAFGLTGMAANLVHVVPLLFAMAYVALAGTDEEPPSDRWPEWKRRVLVFGGCLLFTVALVMSVPAVAEHIDHHRFAEPLPKLDGYLCHVRHSFRIIAVHVKDRRLDHPGNIRRIR